MLEILHKQSLSTNDVSLHAFDRTFATLSSKIYPMIEVPSFKVSVPIPSGLLPREILPPAGSPGFSKATITLMLKSEGQELQAVVKAKSYRDVLTKVDASPYGAYVVLQGKMKGREILEAGFAVQPIVPKEPAPVAPTSPPAPSVGEPSPGHLAKPEGLHRTRSLFF